jgi:hypothetical protein
MVDAFSDEHAETPLEAQHLGSYLVQDGGHVSLNASVGVLHNTDSSE